MVKDAWARKGDNDGLTILLKGLWKNVSCPDPYQFVSLILEATFICSAEAVTLVIANPRPLEAQVERAWESSTLAKREGRSRLGAENMRRAGRRPHRKALQAADTCHPQRQAVSRSHLKLPAERSKVQSPNRMQLESAPAGRAAKG